eukprot:6916906-Alexandrium_andersonii.AAC.1
MLKRHAVQGGQLAPGRLSAGGGGTPACSEAPWWQGSHAAADGAADSPSGVLSGESPGGCSARPYFTSGFLFGRDLALLSGASRWHNLHVLVVPSASER